MSSTNLCSQAAIAIGCAASLWWMTYSWMCVARVRHQVPMMTQGYGVRALMCRPHLRSNWTLAHSSKVRGAGMTCLAVAATDERIGFQPCQSIVNVAHPLDHVPVMPIVTRRGARKAARQRALGMVSHPLQRKPAPVRYVQSCWRWPLTLTKT